MAREKMDGFRQTRRALGLRLAALALAGWAAVGGCADAPEDVARAASREAFDELSTAQLDAALGAAAARLFEALPAGVRREASLELDSADRKNWDFWPSRYPGARVDRMGPAAAAAADELLRLGLSQAGYEKLKTIQALEPYNPWSSPYYSLRVFGDPDDAGWGWRFQGHHVSLNFTVVDGEPLVGTPLFFGVQPLSRDGVAGGRAPLAAEEELARELFVSLDAEQRRRATVERPGATYLPDRTPVAGRRPAAGLPATELDAAQRETLVRLLRAYVDNLAPAAAREAFARIERGGVERIVFAWAGAAEPGRNHYYRLQGPDLLVEYDSRDSGSHIHSVWRSFDGDFGEDLLARHLAAAHGLRYPKREQQRLRRHR